MFWGNMLVKQWNALSTAYWAIVVETWKTVCAESDLNCWSLAEEVSEGKNLICDILVKNVAAFCPCSNSLPEAKVKSFWINCIGRGNLKQPIINFVM